MIEGFTLLPAAIRSGRHAEHQPAVRQVIVDRAETGAARWLTDVSLIVIVLLPPVVSQ